MLSQVFAWRLDTLSPHMFSYLDADIRVRTRLPPLESQIVRSRCVREHSKSWSMTQYLQCRVLCFHGGRDVFDSSIIDPFVLKPRNSPTLPPGLGRGHSLRDLLSLACCIIPWTSSSSTISGLKISVLTALDSIGSVASTHFLLRLRLRPSSPTTTSSAKATRGAGHGRACGNATTKKLANKVPAKREDVNRDRG